jgi:hypothetical protein
MFTLLKNGSSEASKKKSGLLPYAGITLIRLKGIISVLISKKKTIFFFISDTPKDVTNVMEEFVFARKTLKLWLLAFGFWQRCILKTRNVNIIKYHLKLR